MKRVYFHGRILPESKLLEIDEIPEVQWRDKEWPSTIFNVSITNNKFVVTCDLADVVLTDMYDLLVRAETVVRIALDVAAFCSGSKFLLMMDGFTDEHGKSATINVEDKELSALASICASNDFKTIFSLIAEKPHQVFALNDLVETMGDPLNRVVHAARAMDTLRNLIAPNVSPKIGWLKFREALNVSEPYLRSITDASRSVRHGDHANRPKALDAREIQKRAWVLMNRYLEYRKGGDHALQRDKFPIL